jgi:hypothetical protein
MSVIKVMWFLKRADHLTLEEFRAWWLDHTRLVAELQKPHLKRYVVNIRAASDELSSQPPDEFEWDGCAEQWFDDEAGFRAAYERPSPTASRVDTLKQTSRLSRIVVHETEVPVSGG